MSYCNQCHSYNCLCDCIPCTTTPQCASPEDGCTSDTLLSCTHYSGDEIDLCNDTSITEADTGSEAFAKVAAAICDISEGQLDDKLVKISSGDTTSGYLFDKLKKKTGSNITITKKLSGMNEWLELDVPLSTETTFAGIDSDGIDYTAGGTAGHAPIYKVKIDPASDAALTVGSAGVKLTLPATLETALTVTDTSTINLTPGGTHGHLLQADAIISTEADNFLVDNTGLYAGFIDSGTINFSIDGTLTNKKLTGVVKLKSGSNAIDSDISTGLFVPIVTSSNAITKTTNNFKLGGALIEDTTISGAYDVIFSQAQVGIGVTPIYPLQVATNTATIGLEVTNAQALNNTRVNFGISGNYAITGGAKTHSAAFGNSGITGNLNIYSTGNQILQANTPYSGVTGQIKGFTSNSVTIGVVSNLSTVSNFVNDGDYTNVAGLHIKPPSSTEDTDAGEIAYTGTITNLYSILIESVTNIDSSQFTNKYGIYQKGDEKNVFTGSIIAGGSSYWKAPTWTTGGRPGSPSAGMFGYNSTTGKFEGYAGGIWNNFF